MEVAAKLAEGKHDMNGENCDACERIYVHESIWDEFLEASHQNPAYMYTCN